MATKKRKPRRFNKGDLVEAADKDAGLEASKDERVGFAGLGRFLMGNIDDPNSEAYRRFGAGRAKADRAQAESKPSTDVYRVDSGPGAMGMSDEDKPSTNVYRVDSGPGKISKATPAKKPVTRPTTTTAAPARAASSGPYRVDSGPGKLAPKAETQSYTRKMGATAEGVASAEPSVSSRYPENRGSAQDALRSGSAAYRRYVESKAAAAPFKNLLGEKSYRDRLDGGDVTYKKGGKVKKMASGGSTSGASKRADGIAQRGKTRGRIY